jgi:16S rRNA (guanine966-N2)-methyltransferase
VRVIGGTARGRALRAPISPTVRPTADRVREAMFDVLTHLDGEDAVFDAEVLDLFAGSGALGIEALSRGAAHVTFVDSDRNAAATIEANLASTGFGDATRYRIVRAEALGYLERSATTFDLVLADPPYRFEAWPSVLEHLRADIAVLESDRPLDLPDHVRLHRSYRYGTTLVTVVRSIDQAWPGEVDEETDS